GGGKLHEPLGAPLQRSQAESRGLGNRRHNVVVEIRLLAIEGPVDHVSTPTVVLLLAMRLPNFDSTPPHSSFHTVKMVARWGTRGVGLALPWLPRVGVGLALPWPMKEITRRGRQAVPLQAFKDSRQFRKR